MKTFEEIKANSRCHWLTATEDGLAGVIYMPSRWRGTIIISNGAGWEHVSVSPERKSQTPSWEDMCFIKEQFFNEDESVIEVHPPKIEYVNNMPNCLHLWRCTYKDMVLPPSCLVGIRKGQTASELSQEIKEAYRMAGEEY